MESPASRNTQTRFDVHLGMAIQRLNHAVLYVRDVERSKAFYGNILGFRVVSEFPGAAFLQAAGSSNDHDLGIFQIGMNAQDTDAGHRTVGMYHLAWEVDTLGELERLAGVLADAKARPGQITVGATLGSTSHFFPALIEKAAGIKFKYVSYKGLAPRMNAILGGHTHDAVPQPVEVKNRGGATLHALRLTVGDDDFFAILQEYVRRFGGGTATTPDFIAVAEEVSGQDLGQFFDDWLFGAAAPPLPQPLAPSPCSVCTTCGCP